MSGRLFIIPLLLPVLWNLYTTYRGLTDFFDLPANPNINPGQFVFGIVITIIILAFVVASDFVLRWESHDPPALILKAASVTSIVINLFASWEGTQRVIDYEDGDPGKMIGLALVVALVVLSTVFLSRLLTERNGAA